ncbi:MAG: peptidylprolyl isomerase [Verrucomicrobia bacterium]|jgi:peptidyl-prolyl cis-trans isomerase C|nr:peptidylprolyl isomerase [Verrucomicrobiota bacterium]HNZ74884.1 peptidylprolyl isomerase [Verrucomicrobiota bacterium]HOH39005.1 peptidylprolyl isomerase [Verrucomicrobiota bacterium]HPO42010.1 peptidylprolyl isomerase [Verrucomicrobiota bacterium]HPV92087.1 peptidylprolyl isomerase [Verrucomicrobiota bacterium]
MMRRVKTCSALLTAALLLSGSVRAASPAPTNAAPASPVSATATNKVVARGKGWEITRGELGKGVTAAMAQVAARGRQVTTAQVPEVERQVLAQLINLRLVLARATRADREAGKAAANKRYATARANAASEEAFKLQLKFLVTTPEELLAKWTDALTSEAVMKRELKIAISDAEARKYYNENPKQFDLPEQVRASHILIATSDPRTGAGLSDEEKAGKRKKAEAVLQQARAGEDFGKLALAFSNDAGSRARGGEVRFARGEMPAEIEAVAFSLKTNQISDLITTTNGYHIIKLIQKIPARKLKYADAAADIKNGLTQAAIEEQFPAYIARLRDAANVEILEEQLQPQDPARTGLSLPGPGAPPKPAGVK